jgi:hypothetical protein
MKSLPSKKRQAFLLAGVIGACRPIPAFQDRSAVAIKKVHAI